MICDPIVTSASEPRYLLDQRMPRWTGVASPGRWAQSVRNVPATVSMLCRIRSTGTGACRRPRSASGSGSSTSRSTPSSWYWSTMAWSSGPTGVTVSSSWPRWAGRSCSCVSRRSAAMCLAASAGVVANPYSRWPSSPHGAVRWAPHHPPRSADLGAVGAGAARQRPGSTRTGLPSGPVDACRSRNRRVVYADQVSRPARQAGPRSHPRSPLPVAEQEQHAHATLTSVAFGGSGSLQKPHDPNRKATIQIRTSNATHTHRRLSPSTLQLRCTTPTPTPAQLPPGRSPRSAASATAPPDRPRRLRT